MAVLATLGELVFQAETALYDELRRADQYRHQAVERVHGRPSYHFTGKGEVTKEVSGPLFPSVSGGEEQLERLRAMAASGEEYLLVVGDAGGLEFRALGHWVIANITSDYSFFDASGSAMKIGFSVSLKQINGN